MTARAQAETRSDTRSDARTRRAPRRRRANSHHLALIEHVDTHARALRQLLRQLEAPISLLARVLREKEAWTEFGYARLDDYARERLRRSGRWVRDRARLAKAIDLSERLASAYAGTDGGAPLGMVATLGIFKHASPGTLELWIGRARSVPVRVLREDFRRANSVGAADRDLRIGCELTPQEHFEYSIGRDAVGAPGAQSEIDGEPDDPEAPCLFKATIDAAASAAFHLGLELHRAVVGAEVGPASFVEALIAEHRAGPLGEAGNDSNTLIRALERHVVEEESVAVAERAAAWEPSGRPLARPELGAKEVEALAAAQELVAQARALIESAGHGDAAECDQQLRELLGLEDALLRTLGDLLLTMRRMGAFGENDRGALPFTAVGPYAEQRLDISRSQAERLVRLADRAPNYPPLEQAYRAGRLSTESALLVLRAIERSEVDNETTAEWVERACKSTVKRLRDEVGVSHLESAKRPEEPVREPLDDAEWYSSLRRTPGRTLEEIVALAQESESRRQHPVRLLLRLPRALAYGFLAAIDAVSAALPRQEETFSRPSQLGAPAEPQPSRADLSKALFGMLIDYAETWDQPRDVSPSPAEAIYERDGYRCMAPGCTSRAEIEGHHLRYRSAGGTDEPENVLSLCCFHHKRGIHEGLIRASGRAGEDVVIELGRAELSETFRNELR